MPGGQPLKTLVVEDEGLIARDMAQRLEALGYQVTGTAATGKDAVEMASGADLVLMDIRLDGPMDGIEAAGLIRARHAIPVIFVTEHADRSTLARAKQAEPFGYLVKPVAPAALSTTIEIALHRHSAERELAEREAWLRAVFGSVADAVAVADLQGRVRFLNPAAEALTGWSEAEARGQEIEKIVALSADPRGTPVPLAMLRDAAVPFMRDTQLGTRSGRFVPVEGSAAPVHAGPVRDGSARGGCDGAIGVVLSFRDISRRRWEEQQLRQMLKAEAAASLASSVSAEYAHLLAAIRRQAERLLDQFADYSPARQPAEEIRQAAAAAEDLTRKLAGFGQQPPTHPEVLSPNRVLRRAARLLETVAGAGLTVTLLPGSQAGKIKADQEQIERLLMNLAMYAARQSAGHGEIRIETGLPETAAGGAPSGYVRIAVTYPLGAPSTPKAPGAVSLPAAASPEEESLALATAHNIANGNGGFFSTRRTNSGEGCLEVLLPRWIEPELEAETAAPAPTRTILLVEPRELIRTELHKYFEASGFDLLEAADAAEAIALAEIRDGPIDLVIARDTEAEQIHGVLEEARPGLILLRIVDDSERSACELRRVYTQDTLMERVRSLIDNPSAVPAASGATP